MNVKIAAATQRTTECRKDVIDISATVKKMDHVTDIVDKPPYDPNDNNLSLFDVEDVVVLDEGDNTDNNATEPNTKSFLMPNQVGMQAETGASPSSEPTSPLQFCMPVSVVRGAGWGGLRASRWRQAVNSEQMT